MKWSWLDLGRQNRPWNSCRMKWSPQQWGNYSIIHNIKHMPRVRNATSKIREIDVGVQLLEMQIGRHCPDRPEVPQTPNDPMCPNVLRAFFLVHCIYIYIYIMLQCSFRYGRNNLCVLKDSLLLSIFFQTSHCGGDRSALLGILF